MYTCLVLLNYIKLKKMKFLKITLAVLASISLFSCSSDDNETEIVEGETGSLKLKFDNGVGDSDFAFETEYTRENGETYTLNNLKYIISNIVLTAADGSTFSYSDNSDTFIVDEASANTAGEIIVTLDGVNAADYTSVTFGLGIDQETYLKGIDGQGDFLLEAEEKGMTWAWAMGYKFIRLDGTFTPAPSEEDDMNNLTIHMGSIGPTLDNYQDFSFEFGNSALVREDKTPEIHIKADIAKVFDGTTSLSFANGDNSIQASAEKTPIVASNAGLMFTFDHVHND